MKEGHCWKVVVPGGKSIVACDFMRSKVLSTNSSNSEDSKIHT